jgi:hypothetical protein
VACYHLSTCLLKEKKERERKREREKDGKKKERERKKKQPTGEHVSGYKHFSEGQDISGFPCSNLYIVFGIHIA